MCVGSQCVGQAFVAVVIYYLSVCMLQCNHQPYLGSSEVILFVSDVFIHSFTLLPDMSHTRFSVWLRDVEGVGVCRRSLSEYFSND